jgi:DNA gyrase inhibitor GyrI
MKHKPGANNSTCKVISFKNYRDKKVKNVSSTIAAIIAINIDHPSDTTPEDFFLNEIGSIENIEILAFEDALENNNKGMSSNDAQNNASNDA